MEKLNQACTGGDLVDAIGEGRDRMDRSSSMMKRSGHARETLWNAPLDLGGLNSEDPAQIFKLLTAKFVTDLMAARDIFRKVDAVVNISELF